MGAKAGARLLTGFNGSKVDKARRATSDPNKRGNGNRLPAMAGRENKQREGGRGIEGEDEDRKGVGFLQR